MKFKSFISKVLITSLGISMLLTSFNTKIVLADSFKVVTLGANLNESQKNEMLQYFKVTKNEANILEITSEEEYKYLGKVASSAQLGNKSISCSYVEPTSKGGLNVTTNNLTWVTDGMIKNALITAGIENAIVSAAAPFKVSGTAALTGILKGFENSSAGEKIDEEKKEAANEELVITGDLGEKIGQDDATNLINDVKKEVIKKKPDSEKEMNKIIDKATKDYKSELSSDDKESIKNVMNKINDLDLNYNNIKDQLNSVTDQLKDKLNSDEAKGFFAKIGEFFSNIWNSIVDFFTGDDSSDDSSTPSSDNNTPVDNDISTTTEKENTNTNNDNDTNNDSSTTNDSNTNSTPTNNTISNDDTTNTSSDENNTKSETSK